MQTEALVSLFLFFFWSHSFGQTQNTRFCIDNTSLNNERLILNASFLDCSALGLSSLSHTLRERPLSSLDLSQNLLLFPKLSSLPPSLTFLNLSHNAPLQGLKSERGGSSVVSFPFLLTLDLSSNNISSLKDLSFKHFPALRVLNLSRNKILYLTPSAFSYLTSLSSLNLRSNALVQIQEGSLHGLDRLEELLLSRNALVALPKGLFLKSVPRLKFLDMSKNRFAKIEGLSFHGLTELLVLKIKKNAVEYLSDGAFFGLEKIRHLYLDRNKINSVEKGWLYGLRTLETLSLSHNRIDYIAEDAWEFLGVLRELNLKSNHLQLLERDALRSLPSLTHLLLQDNQISHIDDASTSVFEEVPLIQVLSLDGNALSHTIEDSNSPFAGLKHLRRLTLSRNKIKSIGEHAFQGDLLSLEEIDLRSNIISTVHERSIKHLNSLKTLKIDSKSFLCDCYLRWLPEFINQTRLGGLNGAFCAHPQSLKGVRVVSVPIESFTCEDFPKPYILQQPETQITLKGHNLSLYCRAASTSPVEMSFLWKFDSEVVPAENCPQKSPSSSSFCTHNTAHSFDGKGREITSELRLMNLTYDDAGRYQCIVSNAYGATYSDRANITVYVFPTFIITPEDVVVQGSMSATLNCAAKGVPAPKVSWKKDHGNDFPAATERRITQIMDPSFSHEVGSRISVNSFIIHNVTSIDMGVYTCTATNPAGEVSWNISLSVLEVPGFIKDMKDKVAKEGETAVIDCSAKGSPRPSFVWTKDGKDFVPTERHFFAANKQLLIIVKVEPSDVGRYECTIQNQLGSASQYSNLRLDTGMGDIIGVDEDYDMTRTNIIIVAIVCCVIGTSLVWIFVIYRVRKNRCINRRHGQTPSPEGLRECYELDGERRVVRKRDDDSRSKRHLVYPSDLGGLLASSSSFYASHHSLRTASSIGVSPPSADSRKKSVSPHLPFLRPILENNYLDDSPPNVAGGGESVMNLSDVELAEIPFADDSSNEGDIYLESSFSNSPSKYIHNDSTSQISGVNMNSPSPLKLSELEEGV